MLTRLAQPNRVVGAAVRARWMPRQLQYAAGVRSLSTAATAAAQLADTAPSTAPANSNVDTPKVPFTAKVSGAATQHQFQAETHKLLDIVANALYSEKQVFCRELISNAADALEKMRHHRLTSSSAAETSNVVSAEEQHHEPLEICIEVDKDRKEFALYDNGIGMTRDELVQLLGTIARSGSKAFVQDGANADSDAKRSIIGQFGVGFYSAFMVGGRISVYTRSARGGPGHCWTSDGGGTYEIAEAENVPVGTRIVIQLRDDSADFSSESTVEAVVKKYSNFVNFPVKLNGRTINTVQPLWTMEKSQVTEEQHKQFYRFISGAWDAPQYRLHYKADAPVHIAAMLYVPERHTEHLGMGRMQSGVDLYCRRVLIKPKATDLLPEYLRFVKGVVDSEDLSVNLSREMVQQSGTVRKLRDILTTKVLKWLQDEARRDAGKYDQFFRNFGSFLREGVCTATAPQQQKDLAKLLRYESSATKAGEFTSLAEYVERKPNDQKSIYYAISPTRQWAEESPYVERMRSAAQNAEVLYLLGDPMDEFVVQNLREFDGCSLVSVDSDEAAFNSQSDAANDAATQQLTDTQTEQVLSLFRETLGKDKLASVKMSRGQHSHPAIVTGHESPTVRKLMKMVPTSSPLLDEAPQQLELNPQHPIIRGLATALASTQPATSASTSDNSTDHQDKKKLCADVAQQVYDNALIVAGLMDDPRVMLKRLNVLLERSLSQAA